MVRKSIERPGLIYNSAMNYAAHYDRLIERARNRAIDGYVERHHVVPRCIGGGNEKANIVRLTGREHWFAHKLLVCIHPEHRGLICATIWMAKRAANGRAYEWLKKRLSDVMKNQNPSLETRAKISNTQRGRKNPVVAEANRRRIVSDETRAKMSAARTGRKQTPAAIENAAAARRGLKRTPEQRAKMSRAQQGKIISAETRKKMAMKILSPEHRAKISLSLLGNTRARSKESPRSAN